MVVAGQRNDGRGGGKVDLMLMEESGESSVLISTFLACVMHETILTSFCSKTI